MLKVDLKAMRIERKLAEPALGDEEVTERYGLQAMIRSNPQAFFSELGEELLLIGEEVRPSAIVDDRIDLLAIDPSGAVVIIELKRGSHKLQLLQALAYAGMIAQWPANRFLECLKTLRKESCNSGDGTDGELDRFPIEDPASINLKQRLILIAETYDYEVLVTADWLNKNYEVDIRCYRVALSTDGFTNYLSCSCIYPPKELADHSNHRGRAAVRPPKWDDWESALRQVANPAVVAFFQKELAEGRGNNLGKRQLRFKLGGRRRWAMAARKDLAYVWQNGRFLKDVEFWTERLGEGSDVTPVKGNACLRFRLSTPVQFDDFLKAVSTEIKDDDFTLADDEDDEVERLPA